MNLYVLNTTNTKPFIKATLKSLYQYSLLKSPWARHWHYQLKQYCSVVGLNLWHLNKKKAYTYSHIVLTLMFFLKLISHSEYLNCMAKSMWTPKHYSLGNSFHKVLKPCSRICAHSATTALVRPATNDDNGFSALLVIVFKLHFLTSEPLILTL